MNGLVLEVPRHEGVSHVQSPFPKTNVQSATSKIPEHCSVQLSSQMLQEFSTSGNNTSEIVLVKVEARESLMEPSPALVVEEKQQENEEHGERVEEGLQAEDLHRYSIKVTEGDQEESS